MILFFAIFVILFLVFLLCVGLGQAFLVSRQKNHIRRMLRQAESTPAVRRSELLKPGTTDDPIRKALEGVPVLEKLGPLLEQSGARWSLGTFWVLSIVSGFGGVLLGSVIPGFSRSLVTSIAPAGLTVFLPLLIVLRKRNKRFVKFEEQFPEALNFLSRSMRAGHAFTIGLEMLVGDAPEPLVFFFRQILNDLHLGSDLEVAMQKLATAVPIIDVRFFVSAVLLQQGTGGNLSEILDTMANIIRDRFRVKGQIQAASAHGRITGFILAAMPVVMAVVLFFVSPEYLMVLVRDPDGNKMIIGAVIAQIVGFFCIRKIVDIKV
jgi:tight adherence protein B